MVTSLLHSTYAAFVKTLENPEYIVLIKGHTGERVNHGYARVGKKRDLAPGVGSPVRSCHPAHLFVNIMVAQEELCIFKPLVLFFIVLSAIYT